MIPIKQTKTGVGGNCLEACICSLMPQFTLDDFPELKENTWWDELGRFIYLNTGLQIVKAEAMPGQELKIKGHYIAVGKSFTNPDWDHAVIYKNNKLVFDPSPEPIGLNGDPKYYILFNKVF